MAFLIFLILIIFVTPSFGETVKESPFQAWKVGERRWDIEEEIEYARWVDETISEDFFIRYKILIDCADVLYAVVDPRIQYG